LTSLFFIASLQAKTLYIPWENVIRDGQKMVYEEFIKTIGVKSFDRIVKVKMAGQEMPQILSECKRGDLILASGHSSMLSTIVQDKALSALAKKKMREGVTIALDLEYMNLRLQKEYLTRAIEYATKLNATILAYKDDLVHYANKIVKQRESLSPVIRSTNLEALLFTQVPEQFRENFNTVSRFIEKNRDRKIVLIADQSIRQETADWTTSLLEKLSVSDPTIVPILALHPHSAIKPDEVTILMGETAKYKAWHSSFFFDLNALLKKFSSYYVFISSKDLSTSTLIPYVDVLVSASSTVGEVAKESGFLSLMPEVYEYELNWNPIVSKIKRIKSFNEKSLLNNQKRAAIVENQLRDFWDKFTITPDQQCSNLLRAILAVAL